MKGICQDRKKWISIVASVGIYNTEEDDDEDEEEERKNKNAAYGVSKTIFVVCRKFYRNVH